MTLAGAPGDHMAEEYAALIAAGDGGAYVALRTSDLDAVASAAWRLELAPRRSTAGGPEFLSFPARTGAGAVFFGWWRAPAGSGFCGPACRRGLRDPGSVARGGTRARPALDSSYLVLVSRTDSSALPRALGVGLDTTGTLEARGQVRFALPAFWIETW